MQTSRPAVEPESLPDREHVVGGGRREILDGWESREESVVIGCAACDPSPLEKIFRDEDSIRVPCPPPRQIAPVRMVPSEQSAPDLSQGGLVHRAHDASASTSEIRGHGGDRSMSSVSTLNKVNSRPPRLAGARVAFPSHLKMSPVSRLQNRRSSAAI